MITPGNTKLGAGIFTWSIPALMTCPGASAACASVCYALKNRFKKGRILESHMKNLSFSLEADFSSYITRTLRERFISVMRIHVAGDYYSAEYIQKWYSIIKDSPDTRFFFYTRSWNVPELLGDLLRLTTLTNVDPWWSFDLATGRPPLVKNVRNAYLALDDNDAANAPDCADLVFRDQTKTAMKKANGIQVCPSESGIQQLHDHITCRNCGICWSKSQVRAVNYNQAVTDAYQEIYSPADYKLELSRLDKLEVSYGSRV